MNFAVSFLKAFIIINLLFASKVYGSSADSLTMAARRLWQNHDREGAFLLLERAIHFAPDSQLWHFYSERAYLHMSEKNFEMASYAWDKAWIGCNDPAYEMELLFLKTYCQIKYGKYELAVEGFEMIPDSPASYMRRKQVYTALMMLEMGRPDTAEQIYRLAVPKGIPEKTFRKYIKYNRRNCRTGFVMSLLLPGAGQVYAGDWKNGINSLTLNSALGFLFYNTLRIYGPIDAALVMSPWLLRYYIGGAGRAREICLKRKLEKREKLEELMIRNSSQP